MVTEASKNLHHYVKEIYVLVLALGFVLFVEKGKFAQNLFDQGLLEPLALIYFCVLYFSLTYDWIAYHFLTERFPYSVTLQLRSLARFYTDIVALLVKTFLIYLSTQEVTFAHVISVTALFAVWHVSILAWYYFANQEGHDVGKLWHSHVVMVAIYGTFAGIMLLGGKYRPDVVAGESIKVWSLVLYGIIFVHALLRTPYLLRRFASQNRRHLDI